MVPRLSALATVGLLLLGLGACTSAPSAISFPIDQNTNEQTLDYWTPERNAEITPLPFPELESEWAQSDREKDFVESNQKNRGPSSKPIEIPSEVQLASANPTTEWPNSLPYTRGGRLKFTITTTTPAGTTTKKDHYCSAQIVGQDNVIFTAAHCVQDADSGAFYSNFMFERYYRNGVSQQNLVPMCLHVYDEWHSEPRLDRYLYDYAFFTTTNSSSVGHMPLSTGPFWHTSYEAWGYPGNYRNGQFPVYATGALDADARLVRRIRVNPGRLRIPNKVHHLSGPPFSKGVSGGAWIYNLLGTDPYSTTYVAGISSFALPGIDNIVFGPELNHNTDDLYNKAAAVTASTLNTSCPRLP